MGAKFSKFANKIQMVAEKYLQPNIFFLLRERIVCLWTSKGILLDIRTEYLNSHI